MQRQWGSAPAGQAPIPLKHTAEEDAEENRKKVTKADDEAFGMEYEIGNDLPKVDSSRGAMQRQWGSAPAGQAPIPLKHTAEEDAEENRKAQK